jgi:hypothetical protein
MEQQQFIFIITVAKKIVITGEAGLPLHPTRAPMLEVTVCKKEREEKNR